MSDCLGKLIVAASLAAAAALLLAGCERTGTEQRGSRGVGMVQLAKPSALAAVKDINQIPEPEATDDPDPDAPPIKEVFKNVQVLNDLTVLEFSRLMQAMSTWIAPDEGCEFCHNPKKLDSDEKYTKVVARRMLQMTRHINSDWKKHVGGTGVTCWTCHRGQAVPSGDWFANPGQTSTKNRAADPRGQNMAGVKVNGNAALPFDPLSVYLTSGSEVRIQGTAALANGTGGVSIQHAERTYSLMTYMSKSLGVNCTYCHNTRALARWEQSPMQRTTAWHGIRLVRDLNTDYLIPLQAKFPAIRLSAEGDGPKVGCETCHKGTFKPLYGVSMLGDYPELAGVMVRPEGAADHSTAPAPGPTPKPTPKPAQIALSAPR